MEVVVNDYIPGLYGSSLKRSKCVGYCKYHKCGLTTKTLKNHKCLCKQCNALEKYEEHDYWRQRECMKAKRKMRKEGMTLKV